MKAGWIVMTSAALFALSCAEEPESVASDEEEILQLVAASPETVMGDLEGQGPAGGRDSILPEAWWRSLSAEGSWDLVFENDPAVGVCTLSVSRTLTGSLHIDVVHDGVLDPGTKPFTHLRQRRVIVERQGESSDPYAGWVLTHVTPAVHSLAEGTQEVFVASMALYSGEDLLWECTDPDAFYAVDGGLPVLEPGTLVRLEAEVVHAGPVYEPPLLVYAHGPCPTWPRHWMNDEGLYGDLVAGDGVYSYEWYAEESSQYWYVAVDVIDADTMLDQVEDDYDAGAWSMVARKEQGGT